VAELIVSGVKFEKYDTPDIDEKGISTASGAKAAWFKDTEGNIMALIQRSEPNASPEPQEECPSMNEV